MNRKNRRRVGFNVNPEPQVKRVFKKVGRNDKCPCGSEKKFKNCECFNHDKSYYDLGGLEALAKKEE